MKMRFLLGSAWLAASGLLVWQAAADPILPYQVPISVRLTNDINLGVPETPTLEKALKDYHKVSKSLKTDTTILHNLNNKLDEIEGYPELISDAAVAYQLDFELRRNDIARQLIPAPITSKKTSARDAITRVSNTLSNAAIATTTAKRISKLQTAAQQLDSASNSVQKALNAKPGLSKMVARIGGLSFNSEKGQIVGGGDFANNNGSTVGAFGADGVLNVSAVDSGSVVRGLLLNVEGVSGTFPAIYPLGIGNNRAFYDATDLNKNDEYHFRVDTRLTNEVVTFSFVSINYIGTNSCYCGGTSSIPTSGYILGSFAFVGTNAFFLNSNTNRQTVTVSEGEFQLNFDIPVLPINEPATAP